MTRIGLIGCGNISRFHITGYELAGAPIIHVCDVRPEAAQAVADRYGARVSTDYRALLDDPEVDLVSVTALSSAHREICLAALDAGKAVICEKTLTDTADASADVYRAAAAGTFFATAYMKRFFPAAQKAKELLTDMGQIISIYARSWQPSDLWNTPPSQILSNPQSRLRLHYGGGVLPCGGSHILDLIHWFAGPPVSLCGQVYVPEGLDFDIQANALLWLEDGGIVHFETCWHPLAYAGYERNGWDERLEVNTTQGRLDLYTVKWDEPERNGALLVHQDGKSGQVTEYRYRAVNPFHLEIAENLRRFEAGEPGFPSAWDGYVVDEIIAHIYASAEQGRVVPMRWRAKESA